MLEKILKFKLVFLIIIIATLLIFFHQVKWLSPLENFFQKIFLPIQSKIYQIANETQTKMDFLFSKKIIEENKKLREEAQKKIVKESLLKELFSENEILRKELNFIKKNNFRFKMVQI
ncbi:MAG: hypothetical protein AAB526_00740, partial [Patescibacteria group bacterium]